MAAYISVPRDLANVKTKVAFNLTKRQLICFGAAALVGVPLFFCSPGCRRQHRGDAWHDDRHASVIFSGHVRLKNWYRKAFWSAQATENARFCCLRIRAGPLLL